MISFQYLSVTIGKMKTNSSILIIISFILFIFCTSCGVKGQQLPYSERQLIADYGSYPFENWQDWSVSYREGANYYLACHHNEDTLDKIIFMKKDTITVLSHSSINDSKYYLSLNELKQSGDWDRLYPNTDYTVFCQISLFITNNHLLSVKVTDERIFIKGKDFEIWRPCGEDKDWFRKKDL